MKTLIRFTTWLLIPGLLTAALILPDTRLAVVAGVAMWVAPSLLGPLALLTLCYAGTLKLEDPKWAESKANFFKNQPGFIGRWAGLTALIVAAGLAAYLGLVVTAAFYLFGGLTVRGCNALIKHRFENPESRP